MRKSKTGVFRGGWMDGRINERELRLILRNEIALTDHDAILAKLSRVMEVYRFDRNRVAIEPEPADWSGLVAAINVSWPMIFGEVDSLRRKVEALPLHMVAVLDTHLFMVEGLGTRALLRRMLSTPAENDFRLLESSLRDLAESARHVKGIRGPKSDGARPFREIVGELMRQGSKAGRAREIASELLNRCGIRAPKGRARQSEIMRG